MAYYFYLGNMALPVPPSSMTISVNNQNKTVSLINEGEINIIKKEGLKDISFEAMFPNNYYPFADYYTDTAINRKEGYDLLVHGKHILTAGANGLLFRNAESYLRRLQDLKTTKEPCRFMVVRMTEGWRMLWSTNMMATVENFSIKEDAQEGYDCIVAIQLKQYRYYGTKKMTLTKDKDGKDVLSLKEPRATTKKPPTEVKVTKEKSIIEAGRLATGQQLNWPELAIKNSVFDPCGIVEGQVVKLK